MIKTVSNIIDQKKGQRTFINLIIMPPDNFVISLGPTLLWSPQTHFFYDLTRFIRKPACISYANFFMSDSNTFLTLSCAKFWIIIQNLEHDNNIYMSYGMTKIAHDNILIFNTKVNYFWNIFKGETILKICHMLFLYKTMHSKVANHNWLFGMYYINL